MATEKGRTAIEFNPSYRPAGNSSYLVSAPERGAVLPWNCRLSHQAQPDNHVHVDRVDAQRRQPLVFFVMMVAAAEAAVGLAIIIAVFRARATLAVDRIDLMKL